MVAGAILHGAVRAGGAAELPSADMDYDGRTDEAELAASRRRVSSSEEDRSGSGAGFEGGGDFREGLAVFGLQARGRGLPDFFLELRAQLMETRLELFGRGVGGEVEEFGGVGGGHEEA